MRSSRWILIVLVVAAFGGAWMLFMREAVPPKTAQKTVDEPDEESASQGAEPSEAAPRQRMPLRRTVRARPAPKPAPPASESSGEADPPPKKGPVVLPPEILAQREKLRKDAEKRQHALLVQSVQAGKDRIAKLEADLPKLRRNPNVTAEQLRRIQLEIDQYKQGVARIERQLQEKAQAQGAN